MKTKILLVEDEEGIHKLISSSFYGTDYDLLSARTMEEGVRVSATYNPALVILDLGLPGSTGFEVIKSIRSWSQNLPIIVLSARSDESSKVTALDLGANDYVTKPFSMLELHARIRVLIRSAIVHTQGSSIVSLGPFTVDFESYTVKKLNQPVHLTPIEFKLFSMLIKNVNKVIPHKILLKEVWGPGFGMEVQYLRVYMKQLRDKIEDESSKPLYILTEPGIGYRFVIDL